MQKRLVFKHFILINYYNVRERKKKLNIKIFEVIVDNIILQCYYTEHNFLDWKASGSGRL